MYTSYSPAVLTRNGTSPPLLGRWLTRDPIGEGGGFNLYVYAGNNSANTVDVQGLKELTFTYITKIETPNVTAPFGPKFTGGIKTVQTVSIDPDKCRITWSSKHVDMTYRYALGSSGNTADDIADWSRSSGKSIKQWAYRPRKGPRGSARDACKCVLRMKANEPNPLFPFSPGITYNVSIVFDSNKREYQWTVSHDRFPSHTLIGHTGSPLMVFSHLDAETTVNKLWPAARNNNRSGNEKY